MGKAPNALCCSGRLAGIYESVFDILYLFSIRVFWMPRAHFMRMLSGCSR